MPSPLLELLQRRRVIVCAGAGGVGKTTIAAALALVAAQRGHRVLCLTVDPARRLADSLGLDPTCTLPQRVEEGRLVSAGLEVRGSLTALMLDTKSTFDALIERQAQSAAARHRMLENPLYRYIATSLPGTPSYMAMEKLLEVKRDGNYDRIVLDTPPTSDALEFLNAPAQLSDAIDNPTVRWLVEAFQSSRRLSFNLVARSAAAILRGMSRLTGRGFLEHVAEFVTDFNPLFGGFGERAREVARAFRSKEFAYVILSTPAPVALREARAFAEALWAQQMRVDAWIVNRVHCVARAQPSLEQIREALSEAGSSPLVGDQPSSPGLDGDHLARAVRRAFEEEALQAQLDASHLSQFSGDLLSFPEQRGIVKVVVPHFGVDVHDLKALHAVGQCLSR
jgi:anion-transporting  ArsA/GET3 family ATPase